MARPSGGILLGVVGACHEPVPAFVRGQTLAGEAVSAEVLNRGHGVYMRYCVSCHGPEGKGDGPTGRSLPIKPRDFRAADFKYKSTAQGELPETKDLERTIRKGVLDSGMPAWPGLLEEDVHAVAQYIKTFSPRWRMAASRKNGNDNS